MTSETAIAQLAWRCRRGMRELDLLLLRWLHSAFAHAGPTQRAQFVALLELPDPELARLLIHGERSCEPQLAALLDAIAADGAGAGRQA